VKIGALSSAELAARLSSTGIYLRTGPFINHIQSSIAAIADGIALYYADYVLEEATGFADFHISLSRPPSIRRWLRPQAVFLFDGRSPFQPLPLAQAFPLLEWGLNWCIYSYANIYLIFHAAVVEKGGQAILMPGDPGSGKSTICAAMVNRGWRLLSDELALVSLQDLTVVAVPRPVSLKNESIEVIRRFAATAVIGQPTADTAKGTVAHMRAPRDSVNRDQEIAAPTWIIFPRYVASGPVRLQQESRGRALMRIARSSFNYSVLGASGFKAAAGLVDRCNSYDLTYGDLNQALTMIDTLEPPAAGTLTQARV
jgi:HprK-related kinase A